jgi:hypothetical protein
MRSAATLVLATFLATTNLPSEALTSENDSSAVAGASITANILIVKSHAEIANWVVLDPTKRLGNVGRMRTVTRGTKIYLPVVATFSEPQVGQRIALRGVVQIISPTGKTAGFRCFANQVDPRAPKTIVLEPVMDVTFDATDPNGEYRAIASIHRGNETAVASETFRLQ